MGGESSKQQKVFHKYFNTEVKVIDPNAINSQHEFVFPLQQKAIGDKFIALQQQAQTFNSKYLLMPITPQSKSEGLCGNSGVLKTKYPLFHLSADQVIHQNLKDNSEMPNLSNIMNKFLIPMVKGASNFDTTYLKVGDIRLSRAVMNSAGDLKIVNVFTSPLETTGYQKLFQERDNQYPLLAPEELFQLQSDKVDADVDAHKADTYSLGMVLLMMTNLPMKNYYNYKKYTIDEQQIQRDKIEAYKNYGGLVGCLLDLMLQKEPAQRVYISEIDMILDSQQMGELDFNRIEQVYSNQYMGIKSQCFNQKLHQAYMKTIKTTVPIRNIGEMEEVRQVVPPIQPIPNTNTQTIKHYQPYIPYSPKNNQHANRTQVRFTYLSPS